MPNPIPCGSGSLNLDSSVERARVGCWRRVWVGATTLNATAFEEEQHPQTRRQQLNRVRSALTQKMISIEVTNINVLNGLVKITSGQLRNLGLTVCSSHDCLQTPCWQSQKPPAFSNRPNSYIFALAATLSPTGS